MADTYIDDDETRLYGDYAIEQIGLQVVGRLREFDPALQFVAAALRAATDAVAGHLYVARAADPALHRAIAQRERAIAEGRESLQRFSRHLESHRPGSVAYGAFFVEPCDTLARRGPWRLLAALDHVLGSLTELGGPVREASYWQTELEHARALLADTIATDRALRTQTVRSSALELARAQWLTRYTAAKHLVAATLSLSGSSVALEEVFDDLADEHRAEGVVEDGPRADPHDAPEASPPATAPEGAPRIDAASIDLE